MLSEPEPQTLVLVPSAGRSRSCAVTVGLEPPKLFGAVLPGGSPGTEPGALVPVPEQAGSKASSRPIGMQTLLRVGKGLASAGLNREGVI